MLHECIVRSNLDCLYMKNGEKKFNILITNCTLGGYSGTEVVVRDLALGFKKLGHFPMVYSPNLGGASSDIIEANIPVVTSLAFLPRKPDIIHGHHHIETISAIQYFSTVPAIFVCHDAKAWHDIPPLSSRIINYIAVDKNCLERLLSFSVSKDTTKVIFNAFDSDRFIRRDHVSEQPKKALVFSSYANGRSVSVIKDACEELNISVDLIGFGVMRGQKNPEIFLKNYDIVFAKAKCAIEGMGSGAAVILCDIFGLGEMVTSENVAEFQEWNFGMRLLNRPIEKKSIIAEIEKYSPKEVEKVSSFIFQYANLKKNLNSYLTLYEEILIKFDASCPNHFVTNENTQALLQRITKIEDINSKPFLMNELPIHACRQLSLSLIKLPKIIKAESCFFAEVLLENESRYNLASFPPFPLQLSYHWLCEKKEHDIFEGARTPLFPWLGEKSKSTYIMDIFSPKIAGKYQLVITLVQESIRWFDAPNLSIQVIEEVEVLE